MENSLFLRAIRRQPVERTPVWIMRQAGRYLPEYRQTRQKAGDFLTLCKTPELACEVTLQPIERYNLDAAILFSDILTLPDAMNLGLYFSEGEGPRFKYPVNDHKKIEKLLLQGMPGDLSYVYDAVRLIRSELPAALPLIGFAGSPWTLACYMVEGQGSRDFKQLMTLSYQQPESCHQLLQFITENLISYLSSQVEAGVNCLMIFDTWGGLLPALAYQEFSLAYMRSIVRIMKAKYPHCPVILFTKGGGQWLESMAETGCDALGLDWTTDLKQARARVGEKVALQGNLHPSVLLTKPEVIRQQVRHVLEAYGHGSGHIFNLGHGITPDVPPEHVKTLVEAVREFSPEYHCNLI